MPDPLLLGNAYPFRIVIRDDNSVLTNPATLTLTVTRPDATTDVKHLVDFTNPTTGTFDLDYLPAAVGRYVWTEVTTAPNTAQQGWFDVLAAGAGLTYLDVNDLRDILAGEGTTTGTAATLGDDDLTRAIEQAQAEVDGRLAVKYTPPFIDPPQIVVDITGDIAAYLATLTYRRGNPLAPTDPIQLRYNRAQVMLGQAVAGTLLLTVPGSNPTQPEAAASTLAVVNPSSGDLWTEADFQLVNRPAGFPDLFGPFGCR